jgi:hypothetical protein
MSERDVNEAFIAVGHALGFVATQSDTALADHLVEHAFVRYSEDRVFRMPSGAVAYLQAPTGWRQRVRLTVLVREDHPLSAAIARAPREAPPSSEIRYRLPKLPSGNADKALREHLSTLARSGMPVVLEKSIADRINLDDLSPRVVGPNGVQVLQRQTLRVWNTLAVWMREYTRSPRGTASPLRTESRDDLLPPTSGAEPPFLP